jgi:hypothetical protein
MWLKMLLMLRKLLLVNLTTLTMMRLIENMALYIHVCVAHVPQAVAAVGLGLAWITLRGLI